MNTEQLLKERKSLFDSAIRFKPHKRVPLTSNYYTWKVFDAGYNIREAAYDYDIMEKVVRQFIEKYQFDAYMDLGTRNPPRVTDAVGGGSHKVSDDGESVIVLDRILMEEDEYDELLAEMRNGDDSSFTWRKMFPRACREGVTAGEIAAGVGEMLAFGQYNSRITDICKNEYGALCTDPEANAASGVVAPIETLISFNRGIKFGSMDLRRHKEKVKEYSELAWSMKWPAIEAAMATVDGKYMHSDVTSGMLLHTVLSRKQFEEFYWPYLSQHLNCAIANNKTVFLMAEGEILRFADFFKDLKKGYIMAQLENDDPIEFRKAVPNFAISGGITSAMLANMTAQECIDHVREMIEALGDGFIFSQDKMMSYRNDAKSENVLAVNEFLRNYSLM